MPPRKRAKENVPFSHITELLAPPDPPHRPNYVDRLPNELLQEIFRVHVFTNHDTPVRLILVCKLWQSAADLPLLWTKIYYGVSFQWEYIAREDGLINIIEGMVRCSTLSALNRAIERTKKSKFGLTLYRNSWTHQTLDFSFIDKMAVSERCRLLRFVTPFAYRDFIPVIAEVPLKALDEFVYICPKGVGYVQDNSALVENLRENQPSLSTLFSSTLDRNLDIYTMLPLRRLLIQPTSNIKFEKYCKNVNVFKNVEELIFEEDSICDQELHSLVQSGEKSLMPCLKKVELPKRAFAFLPRQTYMTITHLTIHGNARRNDFFDLKDTISFPSLIYLRIDGSWAVLVHFDAPNVVKLILRIGTQRWSSHDYHSYEDFKEFPLSPEILHIDSLLSSAELPQLLDRNGDRLREIRLTYFDPDVTLGPLLTQALCGDQTKEPVCPLLWKFEIVTPEFKLRELYKTTKRRLQRIVDARFSEGRFGKVRHASYTIREGESARWENIQIMSRRSLGFKWMELL